MGKKGRCYMNKQMTFSGKIEKSPNLSSQIPRQWKIKTPRCGLHISRVNKCQQYSEKDCPYFCVKEFDKF